MSSPSILPLLIASPVAGALLLACLPRATPRLARAAGCAAALLPLVLGLFAWPAVSSRSGSFALESNSPWIPTLGVNLHFGMDPMSLVLVLLAGLVGPAAILAVPDRSAKIRLQIALLLLLQACAVGVFLTLDFVPWFLFWEMSLVPGYFLIRVWGGKEAGPAAYQFVLYTLGGGVFMLLGFAALYHALGSFDFVTLAEAGRSGRLEQALSALGPVGGRLVFAGVLLGLAVKVPLYPFHTWLPGAYAEAPVSTSMMLTGILSKMGLYGFLRILWPLFPNALHAASGPLTVLALAGVVLSAYAALRQVDLKRLLAYSSINHLSFCLLALFAAAGASGRSTDADSLSAVFTGIVLQMFSHGLSAAALFFCVGVLEERTGTRLITGFGGVRSLAPRLAGLCGIAMFCSLGLPGLSGFAGEFLLVRAVWGFAPWAAVVTCLGLFATACFLLTFWQRVFHGPASRAEAGGFHDMTSREMAGVLPLVALMVVLGVFPQLICGIVAPLASVWAHLPPLS